VTQALIENWADITELGSATDGSDGHGGLLLFIPEVLLVALALAVGLLLPLGIEVRNGIGDVPLTVH
jgi:hypothetical protein